MFQIKIDDNRKTFVVKAEGFFNEDEVIKFIDEYYSRLRYIDPSGYSLILIMDSLAASSQYMLPKLETILKMYKSSGFKNCYSTCPKSLIARLQLENISNVCDFQIKFEPDIESLFANLQ